MNPYEEAKQAYDDALELARIADLALQNVIQISERANEHVVDASANLAKFEERAGIPKTQYRTIVDQTMINSPLGELKQSDSDCGGPRRPPAATEWYCDIHNVRYYADGPCETVRYREPTDAEEAAEEATWD